MFLFCPQEEAPEENEAPASISSPHPAHKEGQTTDTQLPVDT